MTSFVSKPCGSGTPVTRPCAPYACGATGCNATCASDAECASGTVCDLTTKKCGGAASCVNNDADVKGADGTITSCGGYKCSAGACSKTCASVKDCTENYTCATDHTCIVNSVQKPECADGADCKGDEPPPCDCSVPGMRTRGARFQWAALALGLVFLRRRRPQESAV